MAVPFVVPEDQNEVEVIIIQLQSLLTKLQAALRRSRGTASPSTPTRIRTSVTGSSRARSQDQSTSTASSSSSSTSSVNIPELLNNLAWLAVVSQEAIQTGTSEGTPQNADNAVIRSSRRRTSSESSCCEESKATLPSADRQNGIRDCNQVIDGPIMSNRNFFSSDSIFSKFVPGPVSAPLWTAMICFVGWHLFRAR